MSIRRVTGEQPPINVDPELREWLSRQFIAINAALELVPDFTPTGLAPTKVENGMVRYFNRTVPPHITSEGPWMYVEGTWKKLA